jgi:hypothetical protein
MLSKLFAENVIVHLKTARWLAAHDQRAAALLITSELLKHEPNNKACRSTHAVIQHRSAEELMQEVERELDAAPAPSHSR